jgi:site-specific DNA-methyltransferase (adenine-specific)
MIEIHHGDCIDKLDMVVDKSVQTIIIDPPYNIKKDTWDDIPDYQEWMLNVVEKLLTKLKDDGSLFIFHNNMPILSRLIIGIEDRFNTDGRRLNFRQMIVWNKRFDGSKKKGYLDGYIVKEHLNNWNKMAEYILYYVIDNTWKLKQKRTELKLPGLIISKEIPSKNGNITGWYSNIELGKNYPTRETIKPITRHLGFEYTDIVPKYNNMKTDHSVWNYDMAPRCLHLTPKPIDLLKNLILHTTDEGDLVLDCFAGSGSTGYASLELGRRVVLIERDIEYVEYIKEKIKIVVEK